MATVLVYIVYCAVIMARGSLSEREQMPAETLDIELTCRLSTADFRCDSYGFLLTINPVPSESGTSFLGFLILICSAWKLPSIIKPRIKRFLLKQNVGSFQITISMDAPVFVLSPVFGEVYSRLCAQRTEYSHRTWLWIFIFTIPEPEPLSSNEGSPQPTDS